MTERAIGRTREVLTRHNPSNEDLLQMFIVEAKGVPGAGSDKFVEGLLAAAEEFPPLKRFVNVYPWLKKPLASPEYFYTFDGLHWLSMLNNGRWGMPAVTIRNSGETDTKLKRQKILTPKGEEALKAAASAANRIWGDPTLCPE